MSSNHREMLDWALRVHDRHEQHARALGAQPPTGNRAGVDGAATTRPRCSTPPGAVGPATGRRAQRRAACCRPCHLAGDDRAGVGGSARRRLRSRAGARSASVRSARYAGRSRQRRADQRRLRLPARHADRSLLHRAVPARQRRRHRGPGAGGRRRCVLPPLRRATHHATGRAACQRRQCGGHPRRRPVAARYAASRRLRLPGADADPAPHLRHTRRRHRDAPRLEARRRGAADGAGHQPHRPRRVGRQLVLVAHPRRGQPALRRRLRRRHVRVDSHGNVFAATAFLQGLAVEEIDSAKLAVYDACFPVIVAVRARKP